MIAAIDPTDLTDRQLRERVAWWHAQTLRSATDSGRRLAAEYYVIYDRELARRQVARAAERTTREGA